MGAAPQPQARCDIRRASVTVLLDKLVTPPGWLRGIPGRTVAAIKLVMLHCDLPEQTPQAQARLMEPAQQWFGGRTVVASQLGGGHSWALTDFHLRPSGFERMLVIAPPGTTETRAGRISQRLLEQETYRLMALRGLPVAKALSPTLADAERRLAAITAQLENKSTSEQALLDELGTDAKGVVVSQVMPFPYTPVTGISGEYLNAVRAKQGRAANYSGMEGFVAARVFTEALARAGRGLTRETFLNAVEGLQNLNLGGFPVDFGPAKHMGSRFVELTLLTEDGRIRR